MIKDKVIIITGASSGIGYRTALTLSRAGATIVAGARRVDKLESLKQAVRDSKWGDPHKPIRCYKERRMY